MLHIRHLGQALQNHPNSFKFHLFLLLLLCIAQWLISVLLGHKCLSHIRPLVNLIRMLLEVPPVFFPNLGLIFVVPHLRFQQPSIKLMILLLILFQCVKPIDLCSRLFRVRVVGPLHLGVVFLDLKHCLLRFLGLRGHRRWLLLGRGLLNVLAELSLWLLRRLRWIELGSCEFVCKHV